MTAEADGDRPVTWRIGNAMSRRAAALSSGTAGEGVARVAARVAHAASRVLLAIPRYGQRNITRQYQRLDSGDDESEQAEHWTE